MIVCLCFQRNEKDLMSLVRSKGANKIIEECNSRGCGSCVDIIRVMEKKVSEKIDYEGLARDIGQLVAEKNVAYGDSFGEASKVLEVLYPKGIPVDGYRDALAIVRVIDKLFRLANKKDAFGESPWRDICGYAILGVANDELKNAR